MRESISTLSGHSYEPQAQKRWCCSSRHMLGLTSPQPSVYTGVCVLVCYVSCVCDMFACYVRLHEGLQALGDSSLSQWHRPVGFGTLQGSLVFLAAHQTQHGSVQILVLLLWGQNTPSRLSRGLLWKYLLPATFFYITILITRGIS